MMWNSLVMAVSIAVGKIAISILSAYAIVYFRFPLRMACFWMIFLTLMLPVEVRIMPTFKVVADLGLLNTYAGLTIPLIASATATFLFRQFFLTVPEELLEAARIDGAGPLRFFWSILVPLSRTNIAALFVILFIFGWNQYLWPLLMTTQEGMYTIVMGIKRMTAAARCGGGLEPGDGDGGAGHGAAGRHRGPDAALVHQGPDRAGEMSGLRSGQLRLAVLLGTAALVGAGCAADMDKQAAEKAGESVPRPEWRMGDRWVFQRTAADGATAIVTHQVVAASTEGYTVRVLGLATEVTRQWTLDLHLVQEALGRRDDRSLRAAGLVLRLADQPREDVGPGVPVHGRAERRPVRQHLESRGGGRADRHRRGALLHAPRGALGRAAAARDVLVQPAGSLLGPAGGLSPRVRGGTGGVPVVGLALTAGAPPGARRARRDPGRPDGDGWGAAGRRPARHRAHRGGASLWPENSLTAFRGALGLGVDLVECDVHQTRDGEVLVVHDPTLERTTTGRGAVRDVAWAELAAVTVRGTSGEPVPRLAEVLALIRPAPVGLLLEIKTGPRTPAIPASRSASSRSSGPRVSPTGRPSWRSIGPSSSGSARSPRRSG